MPTDVKETRDEYLRKAITYLKAVDALDDVLENSDPRVKNAIQALHAPVQVQHAKPPSSDPGTRKSRKPKRPKKKRVKNIPSLTKSVKARKKKMTPKKRAAPEKKVATGKKVTPKRKKAVPKKTSKKTRKIGRRAASLELEKGLFDILKSTTPNSPMTLQEIAKAAVKAKVIPDASVSQVKKIWRTLRKVGWSMQAVVPESRATMWYAQPRLTPSEIPGGQPAAQAS